MTPQPLKSDESSWRYTRHSIRHQTNLDLKSHCNHDCFDCHREWNSERAVEICRDFVSANLSNSAEFDFPPNFRGQSRLHADNQNKVDRWFGLIGNQDCNRTKGTSFIVIEPHFGYNPDCFDCEKDAMILT